MTTPVTLLVIKYSIILSYLILHLCCPGSVWAWECRRINPPCFLAECVKKRLYCCVLCCLLFSGLCLVFVVCLFLICLLSCIFQHVPTTWMALFCLIVLMYHQESAHSLTHSTLMFKFTYSNFVKFSFLESKVVANTSCIQFKLAVVIYWSLCLDIFISELLPCDQVADIPSLGVPRRKPHCRSGLATLPSVGAIHRIPSPSHPMVVLYTRGIVCVCLLYCCILCLRFSGFSLLL